MYVTVTGRANPNKIGSFYFKAHQDKKLKSENGRYILLVQDEGRIVCSRMVLAKNLFPDFSGTKTIAWNGAISAAEAC